MNKNVCLLMLVLLLPFSSACANVWSHDVFYKDLSWSPDSRRLALTAYFAIEMEDALGYFPHEAVTYLVVDDTAPQPVVLTPPLDRVFVTPEHGLAAWSDLDGWFILDPNGGRIGRHLGQGEVWASGSDEGYGEPWKLDAFKQSPDRSLVAGQGYDVGPGHDVLLCWNLDELEAKPTAVLLATDPNDFYWRDNDTVMCRVPQGEQGDSHLAVNARTGASRPASQEEYEAARSSRLHVEVPERTVEEPGPDEDRTRMVSESVLVVTLPGAGPRRIRLPVAGLPANPVASPDGSRIALDIRHQKETWVAMLAPDGSGFRVLDSGWAPQWLGNDSILYHRNRGFGVISAGGAGRRLIYYPRNGHDPRWVSDSVIQFRVGRGGTSPQPFHEDPSVYREEGSYYLSYPYAVDTCVYYQDELWQANINTGELKPVSAPLEPMIRVLANDTVPVPSPDGRRFAYLREHGGVYLARPDKDGENDRQLLEYQR